VSIGRNTQISLISSRIAFSMWKGYKRK
jgi:hypothetical protein